MKGTRHPTLMGILNPQSLEQHEQLTTLVVSTTQDCGWSGVGEFVFYLIAARLLGTGKPT